MATIWVDLFKIPMVSNKEMTIDTVLVILTKGDEIVGVQFERTVLVKGDDMVNF